MARPRAGTALAAQIAAEHREDVFPIAIGRMLVVDVAVGQRITVHRALVQQAAIANIRAARERFIQRPARRRRGKVVVLGEIGASVASRVPCRLALARKSSG